MQLAATTGVPVLGMTHLNKEGETLGRRISERARSVMMISLPDKDGQPNRRKFWVEKAAIKKPDPLGITFTDQSNDYDDDPPSAPDEPQKKRGPSPAKSTQMAEWLYDQLSSGGKRVMPSSARLNSISSCRCQLTKHQRFPSLHFMRQGIGSPP